MPSNLYCMRSGKWAWFMQHNLPVYSQNKGTSIARLSDMRSLLPASSKVYTMLSISERSSSKNVMPKKYKCVLKSLDDKYVPDLSVFFLWHRIYQLATLDVAPESILQARRARGTNSGLNDVMMSLDRWGILQDVQKNLLITSSNETFELCMEISSMQRQVYILFLEVL